MVSLLLCLMEYIFLLYLKKSVLIPDMLAINRYNPYKQKFLESSIIFKTLKWFWEQKFESHWCWIYSISQPYNIIPYYTLYRSLSSIITFFYFPFCGIGLTIFNFTYIKNCITHFYYFCFNGQLALIEIEKWEEKERILLNSSSISCSLVYVDEYFYLYHFPSE